MLRFIKHLREKKEMASSTLWTMHIMINGMCKGKYCFNLKQYCRVTNLLKSMDTDIKKKATVLNTAEINGFVLDENLSTPYWIVRRTIVCLAYYGGLRHTEIMELQLEKCESTPEGVYVTHMRAKQRSDKRCSKFLVPRNGEKNAADVLDLCIRSMKDQHNIYSGRLLWTGNSVSFVKRPIGRNMVAKVPHEMATYLKLENPGAYSFHSFRRSAATAVADAGATSEQMQDFFGWSSSKMTTEYISTSKAAVINFANKLHQTELIQNSQVINEIDGMSDVKVDENNIDDFNFDDRLPKEEESELYQNPAPTRAPMKIESGGKVFYINHIENFNC